MAPVNNNAPPRYPTQPAAAQKSTAAASTAAAPNADLEALRAEMKLIEAKDPKTLTADERSDYAKAAGLEKVLESGTFLGFLGKGAAEKVFDKVNKDMTDYMDKNPGASLADIKKHAETRFKSQLGSQVVAKSVVDMAMKQMTERLEELRDTFVDK